MHKKRIATMTLAAMITNLSASTINVLADEVNNMNNNNLVASYNNELGKVNISKFNLYNSNKLNSYDELFKMDNSNIKSITNNGGKYGSCTIEKAIDGKLNTHWETGTPNKPEFTNEVVVTFNEITNLNRVVYAARQDGAKGKGFAQEVEIYASLTEDGEDFTLVGAGEYKNSTADLVESNIELFTCATLPFKIAYIKEIIINIGQIIFNIFYFSIFYSENYI